MPSKKASKKTAFKKSGSSGVAGKSAKQGGKTTTSKKSSSPGVINQPKKTLLDVVVGTVAGAVSAVAEAGSRVTGIGQPAAKKKSAGPKGKGK